MMPARRNNSTAGKATAVNIQRHPNCAFHTAAESDPLKRCAPRVPICQSKICAPRMPQTMASWLRLTRRPRHSAGLISAMYMGEMFDARPMARPPTMRHAMNAVKE
jgi:hypothetical protein